MSTPDTVTATNATTSSRIAAELLKTKFLLSRKLYVMAKSVATILEAKGLNFTNEKQILSTVKWSNALLPPTSKNLASLFEINYFFLNTVIKDVPVGNVM